MVDQINNKSLEKLLPEKRLTRVSSFRDLSCKVSQEDADNFGCFYQQKAFQEKTLQVLKEKLRSTQEMLNGHYVLPNEHWRHYERMKKSYQEAIDWMKKFNNSVSDQRDGLWAMSYAKFRQGKLEDADIRVLNAMREAYYDTSEGGPPLIPAQERLHDMASNIDHELVRNKKFEPTLDEILADPYKIIDKYEIAFTSHHEKAKANGFDNLAALREAGKQTITEKQNWFPDKISSEKEREITKILDEYLNATASVPRLRPEKPLWSRWSRENSRATAYSDSHKDLAPEGKVLTPPDVATTSSRSEIYQYTLKPEERGKVYELTDYADHHSEHGRYEKALEMLNEAFALQNERLGPGHPNTTETLSGIAGVHLKQGNIEQAHEILQEVLTIRKEVLGPKHSKVASTLRDLSEVYKRQDKFEQAEQVLKEAVNLMQDHPVPGDDTRHSLTKNILHDLAIVQLQQEKFGEAEQTLNRVVHMSNLNFNKPLYTLPYETRVSAHQVLRNLAIAYIGQGKLDQAKQLLDKSDRTIRTSKFLYKLGKAYEDRGNFEQAEQTYLEELDIYKDVHGHKSLKIVELLDDLGSFYTRGKQPEKAEQMFKREFEIQEKQVHSFNKKGIGRFQNEDRIAYYNALKTLHRLADVCEMQGKNKERREYLARKRSIRLELSRREDSLKWRGKFKEIPELNSEGLIPKPRLDTQCDVTQAEIDNIGSHCFNSKFVLDTRESIDRGFVAVQEWLKKHPPHASDSDDTIKDWNNHLDMTGPLGSASKWITKFSSSSDAQREGMWAMLHTRFRNGELEPGDIHLLNAMKKVGKSYDDQLSHATSPQNIEQQPFSWNNFTSRETREGASTSSAIIPPSEIYRDTLEPKDQKTVDKNIKRAKELLKDCEKHEKVLEELETKKRSHKDAIKELEAEKVSCEDALKQDRKDAIKEFEQVLKFQQEKLGPRHPNTADTEYQIGLLHAKLGNHTEAQEFIKNASITYEGMLGPLNRKFADTLNAWSMVSWDQAKSMNEAPPHEIKEMLQWARTVYAKYSDPSTATAQRDLGAFHWEQAKSLQGELKEQELKMAEQAYREALAIGEQHKEIGPEHLTTAESSRTLGTFCLERGRLIQKELKKNNFTDAEKSEWSMKMEQYFADAKSYLQQALDIQKKKLGDNDLGTLDTQDQLGYAHLEQAKLMQGESKKHELEKAKEAFDIRQQYMLDARQTPNIAEVNYELGMVHLEQGKYERAEEHLRSAWDQNKKLEYVRPLIKAFEKQEKYQDAKSLLENALDKQEEKRGLAHPNTIDCLNQLVDFYKIQNKFDDATQVLRDALARRENHPNLGLAHSETARSLDQLVGHYRDQGKLKDATKILEEALARRMDKLGENDPETIRCQSQLDNLSENLKKIKPRRTLVTQEIIPNHENTASSPSHSVDLPQEQAAQSSQQEIIKLTDVFNPEHTIGTIPGDTGSSRKYSTLRFVRSSKEPAKSFLWRRSKGQPKLQLTWSELASSSKTSR